MAEPQNGVSGPPLRARRDPVDKIKTGTWEEDEDLEKGHARGVRNKPYHADKRTCELAGWAAETRS
jgi:hypothetical protein